MLTTKQSRNIQNQWKCDLFFGTELIGCTLRHLWNAGPQGDKTQANRRRKYFQDERYDMIDYDQGGSDMMVNCIYPILYHGKLIIHDYDHTHHETL